MFRNGKMDWLAFVIFDYSIVMMKKVSCKEVWFRYLYLNRRQCLVDDPDVSFDDKHWISNPASISRHSCILYSNGHRRMTQLGIYRGVEAMVSIFVSEGRTSGSQGRTPIIDHDHS